MEKQRSKYLNLLTDYAFKRIFGSESCKDLLIDFLNELIEDQGRIIQLKYLPNEQLGKNEEDRKAIFDIYCQTDCNKYFIVELQKVRQAYFKERSIYYSTFPLQVQAQKGKWNFRLNPVYTVAILDFVLFDEENNEDYFHNVKLIEERTNQVFYDKLVYKYLELPKFNKPLHLLETNFERWIYLLKNLPTFKNRPPELQGKIFDKLFQYAEIEQLTNKEMEEYKKSILEYSDIQDALEYAKEKAAEAGRKKGLEEGLEEGREKGLEEGREEGREEEKNNIAKKCLQKGISLEDIAELTGLTKEQINRLK